MNKLYGPTQRPDSGPVHNNAIRRFREELRLGRPQFAELLDVNEYTLRVWEEGKSKPRTPATMKILEIAHRNSYPMEVIDIHPPEKKKVAKKKRRAYKS
jgi:DNA-binding transcriptional regulator YiaG